MHLECATLEAKRKRMPIERGLPGIERCRSQREPLLDRGIAHRMAFDRNIVALHHDAIAATRLRAVMGVRIPEVD